MMRVGLIDQLEVSAFLCDVFFFVSSVTTNITTYWFFFLKELEKNAASKDLTTQLKIFNDHREDDYYELGQRFDNAKMDFDDIHEVFEVLKNLVLDTPSEPYFLSILQHLLFIRDDAYIR